MGTKQFVQKKVLGQFAPQLCVHFGVHNHDPWKQMHFNPDKSLHDCICGFMLPKADEEEPCSEPPLIKKKKMPTSKEGTSQSSLESWPKGLPKPPPLPKVVKFIPPPPPIPAKQHGMHKYHKWKNAERWGKTCQLPKLVLLRMDCCQTLIWQHVQIVHEFSLYFQCLLQVL